MKIDSIKKLKDNKYKIIGSQNIILYDEVILKNNVLFKKELDDELINELLRENEKYDAINKILKYTSKKIRSKKEINDYLNKFELKKSDYDFVINYLSNLNIYNDSIFTESYIYDRFHLSSDGPIKIKKELLKHNISESLINEKLNSITNDEISDKLEKLILKKIKLNHKYSNNDLIKRSIVELVNLGYESGQIKDIFFNNIGQDNEQLNHEYEKLYNKLSRKYKTNELYYQIKQKLYLKGFEIENINQLLDEKKDY